jgi:hypothetical protein
MKRTHLLLLFVVLLAAAVPCTGQDFTPSTSNRPKARHGSGHYSIQQGPSVWKNHPPYSVPKAASTKIQKDQIPSPPDRIGPEQETLGALKKDAEKKKPPQVLPPRP